MYELNENKETKPDVNNFGDWISSIPVGDYPGIRKRIIRDCKITDQIFRHWKCGNSKVPILAHDIINEIAGKTIFTSNENEKSN